MTFDSVAVTLAIVFAASLSRSTFGFGEAMIAMPLLTMLLGIQVAAPLIALLSITVAIGILVRDWRDIQWASAWRLVVASLAGIPIGFFLLTWIPETAVKAVLAILIIAFSIYCLAKPNRFTLHSDVMSPLFGFVAGILGGAYNTQGVPLAVYGTLRQWSAEKFRATLQGFFVPSGLMIVTGHTVSGRVTHHVLWLYIASLLPVAFALALGNWLNRRAIAKHFVRWLHVMLIAIGLSLLINVSWSLLGP